MVRKSGIARMLMVLIALYNYCGDSGRESADFDHDCWQDYVAVRLRRLKIQIAELAEEVGVGREAMSRGFAFIRSSPANFRNELSERSEMRTYVPFFRLERPHEKEAGCPPEKIGGYPFGLAQERWPICSDCGEPMAFVCQYRHAADRLDLGAPDLNLLVFNCDQGTCESWRPESTAQACLLIPSSELDGALTDPPPGAREPYNEVWILGWMEAEEPGGEELEQAFLQTSSYEKVPKDVHDDLVTSTKLRGLPVWIQAPETPGPEWSFVGQIGHFHCFYDPNLETADWVTPIPNSEGITHYGEGVIIGDGGIMYLFSRGQTVKEIAMLWQC